MAGSMLFLNRSDAARQLIPLLEPYRSDDVVVMAVPRGAVPMGRIIADHFHWPLSIVLVKKIGHPMNPEYGIGAVSQEGVFLEEGSSDVSQTDLNHSIEQAQNTLRRRAQRFLGDRPQPSVKGRTVIIVDDGIATGATVRMAIQSLRAQHPKQIIVAAPVAASYAIEQLRYLVDDVVVVHASSSLSAVGEFYGDFSQVTDDDVVRELNSVA